MNYLSLAGFLENVGINNLAITITTDRNSTNAENGPQSAIYSWTVNVVLQNNNTPILLFQFK